MYRDISIKAELICAFLYPFLSAFLKHQNRIGQLEAALSYKEFMLLFRLFGHECRARKSCFRARAVDIIGLARFYLRFYRAIKLIYSV